MCTWWTLDTLLYVRNGTVEVEQVVQKIQLFIPQLLLPSNVHKKKKKKKKKETKKKKKEKE